MYVGKIAVGVAKATWSFYEVYANSLVAGTLSTAISSGDWMKSDMKAGDMLVIIDGKFALFRNGQLVRADSGFWTALEKSTRKDNVLSAVNYGSSASGTSGDTSSGTGGSVGSSGSWSSGSGGESSSSWTCKSVYTGTKPYLVEQRACWPSS